MSNGYKLIIDIGGSKTQIACVKIEDNLDIKEFKKIIKNQYFSYQKTKKGVVNLKKLLPEIIEKITNRNKKITIKEVIIGCPGNFNNKNYIISKDSAQNLLINETINIKKLFEDSCPIKAKVTVMNDALMQCLGAIIVLDLHKKPHHGLFLGIGTGLGGACFEINKNQQIIFFSDGHLSELETTFDNEKTLAQDYISGTYFAESLNIKLKKEFQKKKKELAFDLLVKEIATRSFSFLDEIKNQKTFKQKNKKAWSEQDYIKASKFKSVIFGGGLLDDTKVQNLFSRVYKNSLNNKYDIYFAKNSKLCAMIGGYFYQNVQS